MKMLRATVVTLALLLGFYAVGCGGNDKKTTTGPATPADVTINIVGDNGSNSFSPSPDTVSMGQTVAWHNSDGALTHAPRTISGTEINTGNIAPGATSAAKAMNTPGTFNYQCTIHPTMTGILVVQ